MHLLASQITHADHYGRRKLGRNNKTTKPSSKSSKPSKRSSRSSKPNKSSSISSEDGDSGSSDGGSDDESMPEIPVCPDPQVALDASNAVSAYAKGDSTIVYTDQNQSLGSDVLLELSPSPCGDMHAMLNFDVRTLISRPRMAAYASILIHVIEGSDLTGATFLHTPVSDWSEDSITWRNAPEYDTVLGSLNSIQKGMVSYLCL